MPDIIKWTDFMHKFESSARQFAIGNQLGDGGITIYSSPLHKATIAFAKGINTGETFKGGLRFNNINEKLELLVDGLPKASINAAGEFEAIKFLGDGSSLGGITITGTTDDLPEGISNLYFTNSRADNRISLQKGALNGLSTLDGAGKIPSSQLPAIAITDTFVVPSQVAMLALTAEVGDVAVRTDINKSFILQSSPASTLINWVELLSAGGGGAVSSVNGYTGVVSLMTGDISESGTNYYYTESRFNTSLASKTTDNLNQGTTNKYYSSSLFNTDFNSKISGTANTIGMFVSANTIGDSPISKSGTDLILDSLTVLGNLAQTTDLGSNVRRFRDIYLSRTALITGKTLNTDPNNSVAVLDSSLTITKNDSNTRAFSGINILATLNTGGSNTNTLLKILDIDTVNTSLTGLNNGIASSFDFIRLSSGGSVKFQFSSSGQLGINGVISTTSSLKLKVTGDAAIVSGALLIGMETGGTASLDVNGDIAGRSHFNLFGIAAPAVSVAGRGRIYFDSTSNKFRVSENNGAYVDLLGGGGISGTLTSGKVPLANGSSSLTDSVISQTSGRIHIGVIDDTVNKLQVNGGFLVDKIKLKRTAVHSTSGLIFVEGDYNGSLPTTYDKVYLGLGGNDFSINGKMLIGFGYNSGSSVYPTSIGFNMDSDAGHTKGSLVFATRDTTGSSDVPTERARITAAGNLLIATTTDDGVNKLQVNGSAIANSFTTTSSASVSGVGTIPTWFKYTVSHVALQAAALSNDIELLSLPIAGVIHAIKIKHSIAFTGTGVTSYTLSVGITGNLNKFASAFDVFQATSNTTFQLSNVVQSENHGAVTSIRLAAISNVNTNQSLTGSVDVWVLVSKAV